MEKIFKLEYADNNGYIEDYDSIFWYGNKVPSLSQVAKDLEASMSISADTFLDKALDYFKKKDMLLEEDIENISTIEDIEYKVYVTNMHINAIVNNFNFSFTTVGYSPWSYVLYYNGWDIVYIKDLYNGYNFYDISEYSINDDGSLYCTDTISGCYLPSDEDIVYFIRCQFNVSPEWSLWDNEEVKYSSLPKTQIQEKTTFFIVDPSEV